MSDYIFTGLAPNTQKDDIDLARRMLFRPHKWLRGEAVLKLEKWFCDFLPAKHALAFASGRGALRAILSALGLTSGSEVLLPAYTCISVPGAIIAAGLKPIYVDCEPDTLNISAEDFEAKITPRARAVIIQHTFGVPADVENLVKIGKEYSLFIIEDCAHTIGGKYSNRHLGTFGDAAIFSFGRDKAVSSVFGGVAATSDEELAQKILEFREQPGQALKSWVFQQLLQPIVTAWIKRFYALGLGPWLQVGAMKLGLLSRAVSASEKRGGWEGFADKPMSDALACLALNQLAKLEAYNRHRLEIERLYSAGLSGLERQSSREKSEAPLLRYTIFLNKAWELRKYARARKVFLGDWYAQIPAPTGSIPSVFGYQAGSCPVAESRARMSVNLPLHSEIAEEQASRVAQIVKNFINGDKTDN